jgi:hypothetical protein
MTDLSQLSLKDFPMDARVKDLVSPNFRFYELTYSDTAKRYQIDNSFPTRVELEAALNLCRQILQPIREAFLIPFTPNSFFRSQHLERQLKNKPDTWSSNSQHTQGQACDLSVHGIPTLDLADWISKHLEFDQLICECFDPDKGPTTGWVHVSLKPSGMTNRKEVLSYLMDREKKRYVYVDGLRDRIA